MRPGKRPKKKAVKRRSLGDVEAEIEKCMKNLAFLKKQGQIAQGRKDQKASRRLDKMVREEGERLAELVNKKVGLRQPKTFK